MTTLADPPAVSPASSARVRDVLSAYVALTKPRVIELLLVTTVPTMVLAARGLPPLGTVLATLLGGSLAAGSANALNCWYDQDIDGVMHRTRSRPLVRHAVTPGRALMFGLVLGLLSAGFLAVTTNVLSAVLAVATIAFYVLVYTMVLKRRTAQNVVWGGIAGCMPVVIGWSAVTGRVSWAALVLFGVIFFWTPPHTWALAMRYREDYAAARVPMLPVVAPADVVARRSLGYATVMVVVTLLLVWPLGVSGLLYGLSAGVLGAVFLGENARWLRAARAGETGTPMRLFHWSVTYLALLFLALAVDQLI